MPRDAILIADTAGWLKNAAGDLRAAQVGLEAEPPFLEDVVFHCQQTVEEAFKAFLLPEETHPQSTNAGGG